MRQQLRNILFATDLSEDCWKVYAHAAKLALSDGATLRVLHVHGASQTPGWTQLPALGWASGLNEIRDAEVAERPLNGVMLAVARHLPDMLILGTRRRRGMRRLREGSVSESLTRRSGIVSLFVAQGAEPVVDAVTGQTRLARILIPVAEASAEQRRAIEVALYVARALGAGPLEVILMHRGEGAFPSIEVPEIEDVTWKRDSRSGAVVAAILETAHALQVDLIAMATQRDDSLMDLLLGSRTEQVIRQSPCPVLAIPTR